MEHTESRRGAIADDVARRLYRALTRGRIVVSKQLLSEHPEIARRDAWIAGLCGEHEALLAHLERDPKSVDRERDGTTLTPLACVALSRAHELSAARAAGQLMCARSLIARGADPNGWRQVRHGDVEVNESILTAAVRASRWVPLVEALLDAGAAVDDAEALEAAARCPSPQLLELLLARGAGSSATRALWSALEAERPQHVGLLLSTGADPKAVDDSLRTALHMAVERRRSVNVVEQLLLHSHEIDAVDARGATALQLAARHARDDLSRVLLAHGAAPDLQPVDRLFQLCSQGNTDSAAKLLSEQPELFDCAIDERETLLVDAVREGALEAVRTMLDVGFRVDVAPRGQQPLHVAASHGRPEMVRALLDAGAPLRGHDANSRTPLESAVRAALGAESPDGAQIETIEVLVRAGARPEPWMRNRVDGVLADALSVRRCA